MFSPSPSRPPLPRAQARRRAITGLRPALGALLALLCAAAPSQGLAAPARAQASDNHAGDTHAGEIALTFDDLPAISLVRRQSYVEDLNRRLLAGLRRHRIPATGFVNEGKLDEMNRRRQTAVLRQWLAAGMELGNHTYSHENPSDLGADGYIADIAQGEKVTRPMMAAAGRQLHWFRPPNLELGHPEPVRRQIADWLDAHGYAIAPVTINASDWEFAEPYDDAVARHDFAAQRRIRRSYLAYTEHAIGWYRGATRQVLGREAAHVMLLHATRLNADSIDALAAILRRQGLRPVPLARAMADPAYKLPYFPSSKDGIDWLERWSDTLGKELPWESFHEVPRSIERAYDRVDPDRSASDRANDTDEGQDAGSK